jgi:uncharacterized RDD family membrane protein YckC
MQKADLTTRAVAGFVDLLIVLGLARLPDVIGMLAAAGYLLFRDGLFAHQSVGKKLVGIRIAPADDAAPAPGFRGSILRNASLALAFLLFKIPYAGWVLGPLAVIIESLTALGDERAMRIGDLVARTWTIRDAAAAETPGSAAAAPPASADAQQG